MIPLREHLEAMRVADARFDAERDRRLSEVAIEREKALKIKETADLAALSLAREIQTYKDEKANELRSQIERERGSYVTKSELKPIGDWVVAQAGKSTGASSTVSWIFGGTGVLTGLVLVILRVTGH